MKIVLALALTALGASAQKIAIIDMQGAILKTTDGQKASSDLRAKYDPVQQGLKKRGDDLAAKQAAYEKNSATMSDAAKATAQRDMQQLETALQRDSQDAQDEAQADQNKALQPILQRFQAVLNRYAVEKQISMIVDLSAKPNNLLYATADTNITNDIIALYNQGPTSQKAPAATPPAGTKPAAPATAPKTTPPAKPQK